MTTEQPVVIGRRVLVDGMMGAGKSTFSRSLTARTGLPLIYLDLHAWDPGWARPSDEAFRQRQHTLLAGDEWIIDGNYNETLPMRLERADTFIYLATPWWRCAWHAFLRGIRMPTGEMPEGCVDSRWRRIRDEWSGVWRIWRGRRSERECVYSELARNGSHVTVHVLGSRRDTQAFLDALKGSA